MNTSPILPTPTENTDIDEILLGLLQYNFVDGAIIKDTKPYIEAKAAIEQKLNEARIDGAKAYNRVLTDNIGKPTYMDDAGERHTVYKQVWVGDAIRKANAECISLQATKEEL